MVLILILQVQRNLGNVVLGFYPGKEGFIMQETSWSGVTEYQQATHLDGCQATNPSYFLSWIRWAQQSLKEDEMP